MIELSSKDDRCEFCGRAWGLNSPDYGSGAVFDHYCSGSSKRYAKLRGYTKDMAYRDAGRPDLAERFGK